MDATFLFLGTGSSTGIPLIGCHCAVCQSASSFNQRLRPSGLIKWEKKTFLIDCGPDFRQQAIRYQIDHLDALLLTHTHYDHIGGIDDLRVLFFKKKIHLPCLISEESVPEIKKHYDYIFDAKNNISLKPLLDFHVVKNDAGTVCLEGLEVKYFTFFQNKMKVLGFRIGDFAYITDIRQYRDEIFLSLQGVQELVISALDETASRAHFSVDQAIAFAQRVNARHTWLTHIGHHIDHEAMSRLLPRNIQLGYDGLEFKISL
jgi:phosphoribosyl 1,2-cyclic phosphate phosphodiesterase